MYHLELRQFPHNVCHFNLSEQELAAIVDPWVRGEFIEIEERKWNINQAKLTILEGPELTLDQLTMGRGWRTAERDGENVTDRVLAAAGEAQKAAAAKAAVAPGPLGDAFSLGVQIAALLGPDPVGLLDAWRTAAAGSPSLAPSESLALAEQALATDGGTQA